MNPRQVSRLNQQNQEQEQVTGQQISQEQQQATEFASPEAMLRHDAAQTVVPPGVAERLKESVSREPRACPRWWQRWLRQPG